MTLNYKLVMHIDIDIDCLSAKHLSLLLPLGVLFVIFNLFPALLLVLYPCKPFRRFLSKCKLDSLLLTAFVEKFHGCYREGLSGGRDMRSFSGLYFFLICVTYLRNALFVSRDLKLFPFIYASLIYLACALLIAFIKPYKKRYMNVLDTLLLAQFTVTCILLSREYFHGDGTQMFAIFLIPPIVFKMLLLFKICMKFVNVLVNWYKNRSKCDPNNGLEYSEPCIDEPRERQPLINPTSTVIGI
jgi:hypothetical protein